MLYATLVNVVGERGNVPIPGSVTCTVYCTGVHPNEVEADQLKVMSPTEPVGGSAPKATDGSVGVLGACLGVTPVTAAEVALPPPLVAVTVTEYCAQLLRPVTVVLSVDPDTTTLVVPPAGEVCCARTV